MADAPGKVGERVIAYVDHLGRLEGKIARAFEGGFAMSIGATPRKREKLAAQLTWLANRQILNLPEDRRHGRIVPRNPMAQLILPNGVNITCRVIDISAVRRRNCGPARAIAADRSCGDYRQDPGTRGAPHRRRLCYRVHPAAASRFRGRERHRRVNAAVAHRRDNRFPHDARQLSAPDPCVAKVKPRAAQRERPHRCSVQRLIFEFYINCIRSNFIST